MAPKPQQPSREALIVAGVDAYTQTVTERDEAMAEMASLKRANNDLNGQNTALREIVSKLLAHRDLLTAALSSANGQMRTVHSCLRDMASATEKAVASEKEIDLSGAEAMARRLAPPSPEQMRATLQDRLASADTNGKAVVTA